MKKDPAQPVPTDADLFQKALEGVIPITSSRRTPPNLPKIPAYSGKTATPSTAITDTWTDHGAGEISPTTFLRDGLNRMTLRKLRRGQWPVQDAIDLHGNTSDEARRTLLNFFQHAMQNNYRCVSIVHGKGWRAEGGEGILKIRVRHWLTQHAPVLAFCEAPAYAGGGGAVWVLLKSYA